MKKNASLIILLAAGVLGLGTWSRLTLASKPAESAPGTLSIAPLPGEPDFPLDGRVYSDRYASLSGGLDIREQIDDLEDGKVFHQFYAKANASSNRRAIPDYPSDGIIFQAEFEDLMMP
jgi:hypothetical protein